MKSTFGSQAGVQDFQAGIYGTPGQKGLLFMGVQGQLDTLSQSQFVDGAATSLQQYGITVNESNPTTKTVDDVVITCDPMSGSEGGVPISGAICTSVKGNVFESVIAFDGFSLNDSVQAAADARASSS